MPHDASLRESVKDEDSGYTLIELLVVVFIIGVITAIAIPNLSRARHYANSGSAIQSLRTISTAEQTYRIRYGFYCAWEILVQDEYLGAALSSGYKSNYNFTLNLGSDAKSFDSIATPVDLPTVLDHFFTDQTGVIRFNTGAPADASSPPIPR